MIDDKEPKARVDELMEHLNYYLRHYDRLIKNGFRKPVLDDEIRLIVKELKKLSKHV
jgi:hypothetical protein